MYFVRIVLPRIMQGGNCKRKNIEYDKENAPTSNIYCMCRKGEYGKTIACDNSKCKFQWFYFACVNLRVAPKGKWFCPECKKI